MRILIVGVIGLLLAGCSDPNLDACEDALKATLRAPSSYKRIAVNGHWQGRTYDIEYDAVNAFNAPIRGKGWCNIDRRGAHWTDMTPSQ